MATSPDFISDPQSERTPESNRRYWGEIRRDAVAAQSQLSDFLEKTIVLTPEKLRLGLRKTGEGDARTVEVTPDFAEAPVRWVEMFDRASSVQDRYEIPDGQELVHVSSLTHRRQWPFRVWRQA